MRLLQSHAPPLSPLPQPLTLHSTTVRRDVRSRSCRARRLRAQLLPRPSAIHMHARTRIGVGSALVAHAGPPATTRSQPFTLLFSLPLSRWLLNRSHLRLSSFSLSARADLRSATLPKTLPPHPRLLVSASPPCPLQDFVFAAFLLLLRCLCAQPPNAPLCCESAAMGTNHQPCARPALVSRGQMGKGGVTLDRFKNNSTHLARSPSRLMAPPSTSSRSEPLQAPLAK